MKDKKILNTSNDQFDLDMDDLQAELLDENNFLTKLVDTIPAKMYFEHDIQEKITAEKHLVMDKAAQEFKKKSFNHVDLSAKTKHKRSRLDPLKQKSVSQIHEELNKRKQKKKKKKGLLAPSASLTRAANIEELQKRLQGRIAELQAKRKAALNDPETKKRLKLRVKKLKVKQKGNLVKTKEFSRPEKTPETHKNNASSTKPVFNKDGNFLFSKFDFSEEGHEDTKKNEYAGKKVKNLLKKAERKKEKIENLKNVDPEKAKVVLEKEKWKKAIQKSEGIKVKDDPTLLKKSLKTEEMIKKKRAKVWNQRNEEVDKRKKARQDKRNRNIKQKKNDKFDRKIKLAKKKGRVIPGF